MIRLRRRALPTVAKVGLDGLQSAINQLPSYQERVKAAKARFTARNRPDDPIFRAVRSSLDATCRGSRRCMYCEDAPADEVEHFRPKDLYPELAFAWRNYLYACGPCNGPKNNQFSVIRPGAPRLQDVTRKRGAPVTRPVRGRPALINPLVEDPLDFLLLDLRDTFEFVPVAPAGSIDYDRAEYTLRVLRLNDRDYLIRARETAYGAFVSLIGDYIHLRAQGASRRAVARVPRTIRKSPHPTVWAEMKRQSGRITDLETLFQAAPQALDW